MQLILAIDSDTRRSEQLAALVHARLTVDLVQATSAGEALHALKDRVPDLILTSPLLSPFDDGVLDEYLRDLGAAAAHVQTLRIPMLSTGQRKGSAAKRLFSLGRKKPQASSSAPDGCDPKVFADEIAHYLNRSLEERSASAKATTSTTAVADVQPPYVEPEPIAVSVEPEFVPTYVEPELVQADVEPAPLVFVEPEPVVFVEPEPVVFVEPEPVQLVEPQATVFYAEPEPVELVEPLTIIEPIEIVEPLEIAEPEPLFAAAPLEAPAIVEPVQNSASAIAQTPSSSAPASTSASFEAALAAIRAAWATPGSQSAASPGTNGTGNGKPLKASSEVDLTNALDLPGDEAPSAGDDTGSSDDAKSDGVRRKVDKPKKRQDKPRGRKTAGAGDAEDWDALDPNTCEFSALVKRLDEVTDPDDHLRQGYGGREATTRATNVR